MFFSKLSTKEKTGLFIAITFLMLALLDRLVVSPITDSIQRINQDMKIAERQLRRDLQNLNQKDVISSAYEKYIAYVKKAGSDEEEVARILAEIEGLGREAGVYVIDMKPRFSKEMDFYKEYSVEMEVEADMGAFVNFLYQLNNSTQLLRVEKLRLNLKKPDSPILKGSILITRILIP